MSSMSNKYYTALEPFEVLHLKGHRESNTYIGASMVLEPVYEKVRVECGEELHWLVGGLFHVDGEGVAHECRLTPPVHIFQAKYHRLDEPDRRDQLLKQEVICVEDDPCPVDQYRRKDKI